LVTTESTAPYAHEERAGTLSRVTCELSEGREGKSTESLKQECKSRALVSSGTKYDMVLRLFQDRHGVGAPKRASVEVDASGLPMSHSNGQPVLKKRKPSTKEPDLSKLAARVIAKCNVSQSAKSKWSNNKFKEHASDVVGLCSTIIKKEAFEKGFVEDKHVIALNICRAVLETLSNQHDNVTGWGRNSWELSIVAEDVVKVVKAVRGSLSPGEIEQHKYWMESLSRKCNDYGVDEFCNVSAAFDDASP